MTYVCADLHGEYDLFMRLLEKLRFSERDEMIVCGDAIDKGNGSARLLALLAGYRNFRFLLGNHEYDFLKLYHAQMAEAEENVERVLARMRQCFPDGAFLTWEVLDWLEAQPFYIERENYICVHSGIPILPDNTLLPVGEATPEQLVYDRRFKDPTVLPKTDKCVFFGHTSTHYLVGEHRIVTYPKVAAPRSVADFTKIHLDVGTWDGRIVGCFCVETGKEYYAKPQI